MEMEDSIDHKALFYQMPVPRFLTQKSGEDFIIHMLNDEAKKYFNKPDEELVGLSIFEVFPQKNAFLMAESLKVCLKKKTAVSVPPMPSFPGNGRAMGFWINPILKGDQVIYLDVIAQPTATEGSVVQRERDDALLLLTSIFDVSEVGLLVFDRNRRIVKVNDSFERIFGWNRGDTLGKDFIDFVSPDEHEDAQTNYEEFLQSTDRHAGDVKILRKDGSIANALYTTARLDLSHGRRFQVTTLVDITERKKMEISLRLAKEQADTANHSKSAFLANMSHELRTPLNAIIGFTEMIINETFGPINNAKYSEYLADVHMSAQHLLEIINEVLDMSKIEAGRVELDEHDIDVAALIETVTRIIDFRVFGSQLVIKQHIEENLPALRGDPRLIRQILINLMTNAVKYSKKEGDITLTAVKDEFGGIILQVEDHGLGIPADKIEEAMRPFGQIHDPQKASIYQGTGLGLPLTKAMAELHQAKFELNSVEGEGTRVKITFPETRSKC